MYQVATTEMFGKGQQTYVQAAKNTLMGPRANTTRPRTMHLCIGEAQDLHPKQIIDYLQQQQKMQTKCLQRDNRDFLLTLEHFHQKTSLLAKGFIVVEKQQIFIEDPDWKISFINIFGAPCELSDEVIVEHLQTYGQIVSRRRGHYVSHLEVENGIRHWQMLLNRPILSVVRVGPVRLTVRYEGQPGSCYKCGSFGHPPTRCQNIVCHYCREMGHRVAECQAKQRKCTFCRSGEHLANQCPIANQDLNYQSLERDDPPRSPLHGREESSPKPLPP